jgi:hypothetical protein
MHILFDGTRFTEIGYEAAGLLETHAVVFVMSTALLAWFSWSHGWLWHDAWVSTIEPECYLLDVYTPFSQVATPAPIKLFAFSLVLWTVNAMCIMVHFITYSEDGDGAKDVRVPLDIGEHPSLFLQASQPSRGRAVWRKCLLAWSSSSSSC